VGRLLFLLFTIVPLVELYLLLSIGRVVGFWPTVAIVVLTGVLGASLAKREGLRVLNQYRTTLAQGRMPEEGLLGAVLILVGGVLLIAPGVLTDLTGLCLLFPPTRRLVARKVRAHLSAGMRKGTIHVTSFGHVGGMTPEPTEPSEPTSERWREAARRREKRTEETDADIIDAEGPAGR
jgi:UPF0716 protein FxsA